MHGWRVPTLRCLQLPSVKLLSCEWFSSGVDLLPISSCDKLISSQQNVGTISGTSWAVLINSHAVSLTSDETRVTQLPISWFHPMYSILCIVGLRSVMPLLNEDWLRLIDSHPPGCRHWMQWSAKIYHWSWERSACPSRRQRHRPPTALWQWPTTHMMMAVIVNCYKHGWPAVGHCWSIPRPTSAVDHTTAKISLPTYYHSRLQEAWHVLSSFVTRTTGPGTISVGPGNVNLLSQFDPFFDGLFPHYGLQSIFCFFFSTHTVNWWKKWKRL